MHEALKPLPQAFNTGFKVRAFFSIFQFQLLVHGYCARYVPALDERFGKALAVEIYMNIILSSYQVYLLGRILRLRPGGLTHLGHHGVQVVQKAINASSLIVGINARRTVIRVQLGGNKAKVAILKLHRASI